MFNTGRNVIAITFGKGAFFTTNNNVDFPLQDEANLGLMGMLGQIRESVLDVAIEETQGVQETRGARLNGSQV
ncbi:hypothetical protein ACFL2S_07060, partial [Thermodesulfobacteriota bacterium]